MALTWDISKIENYEELLVDAPADMGPEVRDKVLGGLTNCLIWMTMATGLDKGWELTEEYVPEMYARIKLLEKLGGPLLTQGSDPYWITVEDIQRHVGLQTNAGTKTRAEFIKTNVTADMDRWAREAKSAARRTVKA